RVLVVGVERPGSLMDAERAELLRSRHDVEVVTTPAGVRGKFENLNALLAEHPLGGHDWLLVVDDDVQLPRGFLDAFLAAAERAGLKLAQPAHRLHSHAAWSVTRREAGSTVRETTAGRSASSTPRRSATHNGRRERATRAPTPSRRRSPSSTAGSTCAAT